jgi:class 3 adenylate cyclase
LLNILPATIVQRINRGEVAIADRFPEATILFSDLVGFTSLAGRSSPGRSSRSSTACFPRSMRSPNNWGSRKSRR